jgi:hypothetical protein
MIDDGEHARGQGQHACGIAVLDAWTQGNALHGTDANERRYTIECLALDQPDAIDASVAGNDSHVALGAVIAKRSATKCIGSMLEATLPGPMTNGSAHPGCRWLA